VENTNSCNSTNSRVKPSVAFCIGLTLVVIFLIQGVFFIRANSQTVDEATHLAAGYSYLVTGDFRLDSEHPPLIKMLQALPLFLIYKLPFDADRDHWHEKGDYLIGRDFLYQSTLPADRILSVSRQVNLLLGGLLIALMGWWAYRLWGGRAAALAVSLASLEPNLVAHSALVTTDVGIALFMFLTIYLLWEYSNRRSWWLLAAIGVSAGLALVAKFSALLLLPMIGLIVGIFILLGNEALFLPARTAKRFGQKFLHAAGIFFLILIVAVLTIPPVYFFHGFQPWLAGFDRFRTLADAGRLAFFLGEYSYLGWWSYYPIAFLVKTPIGSLMLIAASLLCYRVGTPLQRREAIFFLVPVAVVFLAMTQARVNIGLRHVLPVYPFLFVLASRLATVEFRGRWLAPFVTAVPLLFTAISSLRIAPHQLAYFNEFVGGPREGYRYLADSNLDWGQDLKNLKTYIDRQRLPVIYLSYFGTAPPSYYGIRYQYVPGAWPLEWPPPDDTVPSAAPRKILAISANNLQDVFNSYGPLFRWLRLREPVAKIGYSIFVYDLTNDPVGVMMVERSYALAGLAPPSDQSIASNWVK
jgi:4-amino-4-deoxy-L-arabinose transferase-like glycosyltransferase